MTRTLSLVLLVFLSLPAAAQAPPEQKPVAGQKPAALLCVYNSRTYSEGATVCVQKAVMQTCTLDGTKAAWTMVTDKELSSRCQTPAARLSKYQQRAIWHRQNIRREITPAMDSSPFCFDTNGKRFCE
ncbi:MAG: DUF1496 domain-containing protein [Pseudomonadota bacterium]|jgi:hypothetical protein